MNETERNVGNKELIDIFPKSNKTEIKTTELIENQTDAMYLGCLY